MRTVCISHIIHLAVNDVLKIPDVASVIKTIRAEVKTVKTVLYKQIFEIAKIQFPPLGIVTRWNSTFVMIKSIQENKTFYETSKHHL